MRGERKEGGGASATNDAICRGSRSRDEGGDKAAAAAAAAGAESRSVDGTCTEDDGSGASLRVSVVADDVSAVVADGVTDGVAADNADGATDDAAEDVSTGVAEGAAEGVVDSGAGADVDADADADADANADAAVDADADAATAVDANSVDGASDDLGAVEMNENVVGVASNVNRAADETGAEAAGAGVTYVVNPSWRVSLPCFLGMKDADNGSRHFLFPRSFCLPEMTLGLF